MNSTSNAAVCSLRRGTASGAWPRCGRNSRARYPAPHCPEGPARRCPVRTPRRGRHLHAVVMPAEDAARFSQIRPPRQIVDEANPVRHVAVANHQQGAEAEHGPVDEASGWFHEIRWEKSSTGCASNRSNRGSQVSWYSSAIPTGIAISCRTMRHGAPGRGTTRNAANTRFGEPEVQQARPSNKELQQKIQIPHTQARPAGNRGRGYDQPLRHSWRVSRSSGTTAYRCPFQVAGREHSIECTQRPVAVPGQQPADTDADRQEQAGDLEELLERHGCVTSERVRGGVEAVDPVPAR